MNSTQLHHWHWQVAQVVNEVLGDEQGDAEQAVVVLDTTEAQLIPVTRKLDAIKALASLLHQVPYHACNWLDKCFVQLWLN